MCGVSYSLDKILGVDDRFTVEMLVKTPCPVSEYLGSIPWSGSCLQLPSNAYAGPGSIQEVIPDKDLTFFF